MLTHSPCAGSPGEAKGEKLFRFAADFCADHWSGYLFLFFSWGSMDKALCPGFHRAFLNKLKETFHEWSDSFTTQSCWEWLRNALLSVILLGRLRRSKKHWATWRMRHKEQSLTDGVTNGVYRSALHLFPWPKWKESSEKTWSFRIVSVRFSAERKNWLGRLYTKTLNTVDLFRWKDTLRLAHFCLGWGRAEWEELFRCSAELEVWPWRSFEMESFVFWTPKVRWTRMAKALLLGFDRQSFCLNAEPNFSWMIRCFQAKTEGYWNNMEQLFCMLVPVSGNPEAEGNGRFHQRPQYDRDRFFRRQQTLCTLHSKV